MEQNFPILFFFSSSIYSWPFVISNTFQNKLVMFYKNANWDLFGLCACIGQFGDKPPLETKSE